MRAHGSGLLSVRARAATRYPKHCIVYALVFFVLARHLEARLYELDVHPLLLGSWNSEVVRVLHDPIAIAWALIEPELGPALQIAVPLIVRLSQGSRIAISLGAGGLQGSVTYLGDLTRAVHASSGTSRKRRLQSLYRALRGSADPVLPSAPMTCPL